MTMNDIEWPFYFKFSLSRTTLFYIFTVVSVYTRDQRRYADVWKRTVIRRIFVVGPQIWNDLPEDVASAESLSIFRQRHKTHLFTKSFPDCFLDIHSGRGAAGSRGSIDPPLFEVPGPPMQFDPHF